MVDQLATCQQSETTGRVRTRFFPGLLLGSNDLTQEQTYFLEKHRRHNRLLHGWGVVCGARVRPGQGACEIIIEPGYILGPFGDEILIDEYVTVDLCREGLDGNAISPCGDALDPWCSEVRVDRQAGQTLYVAIRYDECQTRPVRSGAGSCGCDLSECEYSRIRDSFAIKALTRLPSNYDPMPPTEIETAVTCGRRERQRGRACTVCPTEPWVILADVTISADGSIDEIDCFRHRRYVASFADYYFLCTEPEIWVGRPDIEAVGEIARRVGRMMMVDMSVDLEAQPRASVAVRSLGGEWLSLPIHFSITPGETWADLLERERDREYFNPLEDDRFILGELVALAGIDPDEEIETLDDALLPIEGLRVNIRDLRAVRTELDNLLVGRGIERWEREHAGTIESLTRLPATDLEGVGTRSRLAQLLENETIGSMAAEDRNTFVARMVEGVTGRQRVALERQARSAWTAASRLARRRESWIGQ
jgi:hypothetical protein